MIKSLYLAIEFNGMNESGTKMTIGRREIIDFPDLDLFSIEAKIDTGALTSVLHCHDIREENGVLYFILLDPSHPEYNEKEQQSSGYYQKEIKNSFGEVENRYIIKTTIRIGHRRIKALISLTDRGTMRYPVLIGRRFLKNKFIVDVSQLNCITPHNSAKKNPKTKS